MASSSGPIEGSPSPRRTQSMLPPACSRISRALNDALLPPTITAGAGGQALAGGAREIDDLGHVRQVVAGEHDGLRPPPVEQAKVVLVGLALQVEQAHVVPGGPSGGGHQLEPERLEAQEDLRVHQPARM